MTQAFSQLPAGWTFADLWEQVGGVHPRRIRVNPAPGTATEQDVIDIATHEDRLFELIDGILVEKVMGARESMLAGIIVHQLCNFLEQNDLGAVTTPDGTLRFAPQLVRIPDVAFISWTQMPSRKFPTKPIPDLVPELAIEVLSEGNTPGEMQRKLKDYFLSGVLLVWFVDPDRRIVQVFTAPDQSRVFREGETVDGGKVLPGFTLSLDRLFARVERTGKPASRKKGKKNR